MSDVALAGETALDEEAVSVRVQRAAMPFYASRIKVYPKRVQGLYRRIKWGVLLGCLGLYYVVPWLRWSRGAGAPDQAVLIDLPGRRAYFLWIEIWPQEVYYLTGLLILGAVGLFLATAVMGRVWCGYTCPQTVWTDIFMWVEGLIEGDRNARMKLDGEPWSGTKVVKKATKHAAWLLISLATGGAWVLYFNDAPTVTRELFTLQASPAVYFFVALFATTTYLLAGWAREQVCTFMCPWPRFQAAMLDENSFVVTYQGWRGEPRAKHKAGTSWEGRGDCIDCGLCVAVCPTGIDIRDGDQLECIGCGLCVDACNSVMAKVDRPAELITFDTLANQAAKAAGKTSRYRLIRPRVVIYAGMLVVVALVMLGTLLTRATVEVNVLRERNPLYVALSDGAIRNGYTLKILNKLRAARDYELNTQGVAGLRVSAVGSGEANEGATLRLSAKPDSVATYRIYLTAPRESLATESSPVAFSLRETSTGETAEYHAVFIGPSH